jgi:SAM-dependent methyltransferase
VEQGSHGYLFPRHPSEVNRLDLQHFALREALGVNFFAPIERPERIIDVGTGSGQWCVDTAAQFPQALVVGLDLVSHKPARERRFDLVRGDVTAGLPFQSETFDFVHQRLLRAGIPVVAWPEVAADLVRVTRPGGWVELMEVSNNPTREGPATSELFSCLSRLAATRGLAPDDRVVLRLERLLAESGLEQVSTRRVEFPVGEWGGRPGSFMSSDLRAMFMRLAPAFEARFSIPQDRTLELIGSAVAEMQEMHSSAIFFCAWGQRPPAVG